MLKKFCGCGIIISQEIKMCPKCADKKKVRDRETKRSYKATRGDKKEQHFYTSADWKLTRDVVKNRDKGLCKLCQSNDRVSFVNTVHHIEELKDEWSLRMNMSNLICLCDRCHLRVHSGYRLGGESKKEIQEKLKAMIL